MKLQKSHYAPLQMVHESIASAWRKRRGGKK